MPASTDPSGALQNFLRLALVLLPLVCWPDLAHPFSTPKLALILLLDAIAVALLAARRGGSSGTPVWPALVWVTAVSASVLLSHYASQPALLLALAPIPLFWACARGLLAPVPLAAGVALGSALESLIALLQSIGADPLRLLGWHPESFPSPRMRVYGTLGNPDFVAAWCCATLPAVYFTFVERARSRRAAGFGAVLVAVQFCAILATGSRAALPVLAVQAVVLAACRAHGWKRWLAMAPLAALVLLLPGSRTLAETLQGRLYLARVSVSQTGRIPPAGYGPGSFEPQFSLLQVQWLHNHGTGNARFVGIADHAHNDYLEFLVEYGPLGLCAFLAVCCRVLAAAWQLRRFPFGGAAAPAAATFAALVALACFDFPLHRPAEWTLFWLSAGVVLGRRSENAV